MVYASVEQWIAQLRPKEMIAGSIPVGGTFGFRRSSKEGSRQQRVRTPQKPARGSLRGSVLSDTGESV